MPSWSSDRRFGKSLDEQKRDRDQRYRDARAEASTEYLADIASDGPDCGDDQRPHVSLAQILNGDVLMFRGMRITLSVVALMVVPVPFMGLRGHVGGT